MVTQIPKRLLNQNAKIKLYNGNGGSGPVYLSEIDLKHIRVEKHDVIKRGLEGQEVIGKALMFYDIVNSQGLSEEPRQNSIVTFEDKEYRVVEVDTLYATKKHHYEIILK